MACPVPFPFSDERGRRKAAVGLQFIPHHFDLHSATSQRDPVNDGDVLEMSQKGEAERSGDLL